MNTVAPQMATLMGSQVITGQLVDNNHRCGQHMNSAQEPWIEHEGDPQWARYLPVDPFFSHEEGAAPGLSG